MKKKLFMTALVGATLLLGACNDDSTTEVTEPVVQDTNSAENQIPVSSELKQNVAKEIEFTGIKYTNVVVEDTMPKLNAYLVQTAEDTNLIGEKNVDYVVIRASYEVIGNTPLDLSNMHTQYLVREDGYKIEAKTEIIANDILTDAGYDAINPIYGGMNTGSKGDTYFVFPVGKTLSNDSSKEWFFTASKLKENNWANEKISIGQLIKK